MLESFPIAVLAGILMGFLSGLGIGGGSLLMLWLTLFLGMDHTNARGINLLFFVPSALIACLFRWRQGSIKWKQVLPAIIGGCAAAAGFSWLSVYLDTAAIKKMFGILLIATGLRELFYRPRNAR